MTLDLTKRELTILLFAVPQLQDVVEAQLADEQGRYLRVRCLWEEHCDGPFPTTVEFNELTAKLYRAEGSA